MTNEEISKLFAKTLKTEETKYKDDSFEYSYDDSLIKENIELQDLIIKEISKKDIGMFLFNNEFLMCFFNYNGTFYIYGPMLKQDNLTNMDSHSIKFNIKKLPNYKIYISLLISLLAYNYTIITGNKFEPVEFLENNFRINTTNYQSKETVSQILIESSMNEKIHADGQEFKLLKDSISEGNIPLTLEAATDLFKSHFSSSDKYTLQQNKYRVITLISVVSQTGIRNGIHPELVYSLEDSYFIQIEKRNSLEGLLELFIQYSISVTKEVKDVKSRQKSTSDNLIVWKAKAYIAKHLSDDVSVAGISRYLNVSPNYLSFIFKKVENVRLSEYVTNEKIELAKKILADKNIDNSQVAFIVGFSTQSHFCSVFKKYTKMTPKEYTTYIYKNM